ncbi:hypothetical protein [Pedobacter deserti]|uniref:hypothetical protein n=1 Tax=Pedobacter deserti TaxID=2817382 RepID=UPI0021093B63|nr:hypothetical protein [Pedobacter sp. SYSU D00382]
MEQFKIQVADSSGYGHIFNIRALSEEKFQIYNDHHERMATIEIDHEDDNYCRQSLDCRIDLPLLDAIKECILMHDELVIGHA